MSAVIDGISALAASWEEEAARRRVMSPHDVTADILAHCAARVLVTIEESNADDEELTPAEYGAQPHIGRSASSVRKWCQFNQIVCRRVGRDYRIRRGAEPPAFAAES